MSQQMEVLEGNETLIDRGLLVTTISALSLNIGKDDLIMNFTGNEPNFSMTIQRTFDSIKSYFLQNTNELA